MTTTIELAPSRLIEGRPGSAAAFSTPTDNAARSRTAKLTFAAPAHVRPKCYCILQCKRIIGNAMASGKTSTLTFRIEPALKEALRTAADHEHRSIANMVEVMIRDYCGRTGVPIQASPAPTPKAVRPAPQPKHQ